MKTFFWTLSLLIACILTACGNKTTTPTTTTETTTTTTPANNNTNADYTEPNAAAANDNNFVDKKIVYDGKIADQVLEHMMYTNPMEKMSYLYIDPIDGRYGLPQMAVYFKEGAFGPSDSYTGKTLRVYGTLKSMTGAGKGGGEHTERYLLLDKLEAK